MLMQRQQTKLADLNVGNIYNLMRTSALFKPSRKNQRNQTFCNWTTGTLHFFKPEFDLLADPNFFKCNWVYTNFYIKPNVLKHCHKSISLWIRKNPHPDNTTLYSGSKRICY